VRDGSGGGVDVLPSDEQNLESPELGLTYSIRPGVMSAHFVT
jgi:C4-type Zn-finger protein